VHIVLRTFPHAGQKMKSPCRHFFNLPGAVQTVVICKIINFDGRQIKILSSNVSAVTEEKEKNRYYFL
jgi:hypothetical protein